MQVLEGQDIYLRPMTKDDTDNIIKWRNRDFVRDHFIFRETFTRETHENWIQTMIQTKRAEQFIICLRKSNCPIGSIYLRDIDDVFHHAEYGIFIGEQDAMNKGYGTQAAKLMISYAFDVRGLHKLKLRLFATNVQAQKSYEKAGFVQEAYLKDEVFLNGKYEDMILMAIIKQEGEKKE